MTTPIAAGPLDRRVGHQPILDAESGHCLGACPYLDVWQHPFFHHAAWCWKQMRDLAYYDGLIADCLRREPDENLSRLPANMMPNVELTGASRKAAKRPARRAMVERRVRAPATTEKET